MGQNMSLSQSHPDCQVNCINTRNKKFPLLYNFFTQGTNSWKNGTLMFSTDSLSLVTHVRHAIGLIPEVLTGLVVAIAYSFSVFKLVHHKMTANNVPGTVITSCNEIDN